MAKRGRKQDPALRWDGSLKQWYRRYDGKKMYFGADKQQAHDRWLAFEQARLAEAAVPVIAPLTQKIGQMFDILERQQAAKLVLTNPGNDADEIMGQFVWRSYGQSLPDTIEAVMRGVAVHLGIRP